MHAQVSLKVIFQRVALYTPSPPVQDACGQIALTINLTVPATVQGSIASAFMQQMKVCLGALMREAKSELVAYIIDSFLMVHAATMPPRVVKALEEVYEARKAVHRVEFARMLQCPGGFDITQYKYMYAFHAAIGADGQVCA